MASGLLCTVFGKPVSRVPWPRENRHSGACSKRRRTRDRARPENLPKVQRYRTEIFKLTTSLTASELRESTSETACLGLERSNQLRGAFEGFDSACRHIGISFSFFGLPLGSPEPSLIGRDMARPFPSRHCLFLGLFPHRHVDCTTEFSVPSSLSTQRSSRAVAGALLAAPASWVAASACPERKRRAATIKPSARSAFLPAGGASSCQRAALIL